MQYLPFLLYFMMVCVVALVPMTLHKIINARRITTLSSLESSTYECGFDAENDARMPFYAPFYLIAILFVLFDLEMAFLFPWAMLVKNKAALSLLMAGWSFIILLLAGLIYEWKKGVLSCLFSP